MKRNSGTAKFKMSPIIFKLSPSVLGILIETVILEGYV
jgi:hypothetical protein